MESWLLICHQTDQSVEHLNMVAALLSCCLAELLVAELQLIYFGTLFDYYGL